MTVYNDEASVYYAADEFRSQPDVSFLAQVEFQDCEFPHNP